MTTSQKKLRTSEKINAPLTEADKAYFRATTRRQFHGVVLRLFDALSEDKQLTRADLAKILRANPAQVTRWLSSPGNWTIDTVSDLLLAMSHKAELVADQIGRDQMRNFEHPTSTLTRDTETASTETLVEVHTTYQLPSDNNLQQTGSQ